MWSPKAVGPVLRYSKKCRSPVEKTFAKNQPPFVTNILKYQINDGRAVVVGEGLFRGEILVNCCRNNEKALFPPCFLDFSEFFPYPGEGGGDA